MADTIDVFSTLKDAVKGGASSSIEKTGGFFNLPGIIGIFAGIAIIVFAGVVIWWWYSEKKRWNMVTRVHAENPNIDGVSLNSAMIPTRRVRFKDGKVCFLYKHPIQGYTISPELLVYTRPMQYDIIVTQDKKMFCLIGIENINTKRKILNVHITYPDIEMDRQDLQNHIDSKKYDDPNERLKMLLKAGAWTVGLVALIIIVVMFGKYYIESKEVDAQRDKLNLEVSEQLKAVVEAMSIIVKYQNDTINKPLVMYAS
jgi:hypothetical protein